MKKALVLVLAAVMAFGMSVSAFAATKISEVSTTGATYFDTASSTGLIDEIKPEHKWELEIDWSKLNYEQTAGTNVTMDNVAKTVSMMRTNKLVVRRTISKGSNLIDSIEWKQDSASGVAKRVYIKIEAVEDFVSIKDQDISMKVRLYLDGTQIDELEIDATMKIDELEVYAEDDYIYLGDGQVADPEKYVSGIKMDLGEGVIVTGNLFANRKYYGIAKSEVTAADDAVIAQYPSIDNVITIYQINLPTNGNCVTFEDMDGQYYVYNKEGNYIGTSNEALPFSEKYYLSTERITMTSESSSEPTESSTAPTTPVDPAQPTPGGDDL